MRNSFIYLTSVLIALFFISCASKKIDDTAKKEETAKEEVKKAEAAKPEMSKDEIKKESVKKVVKKEVSETEEPNAEMAKGEEKIMPASDLSVENAAMVTNIDNLTPSGEGTEFTKETSRIYCYSKVIGAADETSIKHIWYHGDKMAAEIELPVKSESWRTYSYKTIVPEFEGAWRVDITTSEGKVLKSLNFEIK